MPEISLFCGIRVMMFYSDIIRRTFTRNMVAVKHLLIFKMPV